MQYYNKFYGLARTRVVRALERAFSKENVNAAAKKREEAVLFYHKYGYKLTQEAYGVKRRTLLNWQKKYKEIGIIGLIDGNRAPKHKRQSKIRQEVKDFIKEYRLRYGNIHQEEIKEHLDEHCQNLGIETTSTASIGRIIRELKDKGEIGDAVKLRFNAKSGKLSEVKTKYKQKNRIGKYKPNKPGGLIQADSVHLLIDGKKQYLINAVDVKGKIAFSKEYNRLNSGNAKDFFETLRKEYPFKINRIQTDNGSEFDGYAHKYLEKHNLTHYWNYPRCPKSNAFVERFNRTIKEQFVYRNEDCIENCNEANKRIKDRLLWYNTQRGRKSLNYKTPLHYSQSLLNPNMRIML
jgi:transposase-like protein